MLGAWIRIRAQKAGTKFRALQRSHVIYSALDHPDTRWLVRQLTEFATPASLSCRAGAAAERCWTPSVDAVLRGGPVDSRAGSLAGALEKRANTARRWCWGLRYAITRGAAFAHAAEHSGGASRCRFDSPAEQLWYADAALLPGRRSRCDVLDTLRGRRTACWPARMTCVLAHLGYAVSVAESARWSRRAGAHGWGAVDLYCACTGRGSTHPAHQPIPASTARHVFLSPSCHGGSRAAWVLSVRYAGGVEDAGRLSPRAPHRREARAPHRPRGVVWRVARLCSAAARAYSCTRRAPGPCEQLATAVEPQRGLRSGSSAAARALHAMPTPV